jgi:thiamine pyrophosphokinase
MKEAIILANGDFPSHSYPLALLRAGTFRVCCDGAAEALLAFGLEPDIIVGDLDSLPTPIRRQYASLVIHDPDQETNDLTKAVGVCRKHGYDTITILGATGKREDHTLGNIGLFAGYAREVNVKLVTDHGEMFAVEHQGTVPTTPGQQISFFNTSKGIPVTVSNVKYPVSNLLMDEWWQGTLNEATSDAINITAPGARIIVFRLYQDTQTTV